MTRTQHRWRARRWSAPDFFEQLRREDEFECIEELVRSFRYFTSARLQLLSDLRALTEQQALLELRSLKDSCRQVGADRMAFLCGEIEKYGLKPKTDAFRYLRDALREEGRGVMHDMRVYAIGLKSQAISAAAGCGTAERRTTDSALLSSAAPNNVVPLTPLPALRQRIAQLVRMSGPMSMPISAKKT